jgi:thiosulfate/3-mercaptopyruvate sulfurtransferase
MRWIVLLSLTAAAAYGAAPGCGGHGDRSTMLVTTEWLAGHAKEPDLVLLAVGQKSEFDQGHIPGSLFLDYNTIVLRATAEHPNSFELPPMADLAATFSQLGVSNSSRVVLYMTKDYVSPTTRVYLTLDAMGLGRRTSLLDGGFPAWKAENRAVTTDVAAPKPGKITPCAQNDVIVDLDYVKSNLRQKGVALVDARTANFYSGEAPGRNMRAGHIPGAVSLPYVTLVDEQNKFHSLEQMSQQFSEAGIQKGDRVVSYCHIGQQATVLYFVARYLGYDARLYDGSLEEWSRHAELPVEKK